MEEDGANRFNLTKLKRNQASKKVLKKYIYIYKISFLVIDKNKCSNEISCFHFLKKNFTQLLLTYLL